MPTINLTKEMDDHLTRLKSLADEALDDGDSTLASRASAMGALTTMLKELKKAQEDLQTMDHLMQVEAVVIELCKEVLQEEALESYIETLESRLGQIK